MMSISSKVVAKWQKEEADLQALQGYNKRFVRLSPLQQVIEDEVMP